MQAIKCELCGSGDVVKQGIFFVCQHCGTKYNLEEARALIGTVKLDKTDDIANYFTLARRYFAEKNYIDSEKYYALALQEVPNDLEAVFYHAYCRALTQGSDVANISSGYLNVLKLAKENLPASEQKAVISRYTDIVVGHYQRRCDYIGEQYRRSRSATYGDYMVILESSGKMYAAIEKYLTALYPEFSDIINNIQNKYFSLLKEHPEAFPWKHRREESARLKKTLG